MGRPLKKEGMYPNKLAGNCRTITVRIPMELMDWMLDVFMPLNKKYGTVSSVVIKCIKMVKKEFDRIEGEQNPTATGGI